MRINVQKEIKKITEQIIKKYRPERVILFGSAISGELMPGSDIDLLVVKETKKNPWIRIKELDQFIEHKIPFDLLVYTPKEIEKRIIANDFFLKEIIKRGKVIYEKGV